MKALVGAFNQEKALVGAFSVIVQPVVEQMDRFAALFRIQLPILYSPRTFYIPVPESATARVGSKFLAPATNTSSIFYDNVDNFHADVNGTWINKFARN